MNDKTKILYDQLTKDGYDVGDYNSFSNNVKDDNKRKNLYNAITKDGYDVGDYDTFSAKLVGNNSQPTGVNNVTTTPQPTNTEETFVQNPKVRERILANTPDYFKSKGNNLSTLPLGTNIQDANDIAQEEQQRVAFAERAANDPYMRQQELEHVFKPKNQEQINSVNKMIADARRKRAEERRKNARAVKSDGLFSTLSQAYVAGEQNDTDKQLEYASSLMEEAQNITNEAKKKGNTNFFAGFARGFKDSPLDAWSMGLQDLKNYSAAKKVLDKVDKGEQLNPAEDALMQALVTNAATKMYYSGDLGRGYKAGGVTAESLPFMLDMIVGMGTIQAATKPAAKALYKYALKKIGKDGLGNMSKKAVRGAVRTISGLGDVAAHTATFGGARVAADYQRRGMGDIQVSPNTDGTVSYAGRNNVQTGAEAIAKSVISTAAETGTELLGEYFAPMLGWVGKVTGANKIGKIIPASVGKAYSNIVNSQGFKNIQEIASRAKIADPIGEYGEEVVNNLISTAIGDMTPEELVDLDQNIDTFLGVAPMSVLFGAAGTGGYLREKYKNYRDMRTFENEMQETMGEDWSGVKEALQDADIETARDMVKDVLSSDMQPDMKKKAINYISSVLQEQTLQEVDKQQMPEQIAQAKQGIIANMQKYKDTLIKKGMSENEISTALNDTFDLSPEEMEGKYGVDRANDIYNYRNAYTDYADYNYWVQNKAFKARKEAESQVEKMTNATTGTVMRVKSGLSQNPVNILRGNIVFDNNGNVDQNQSDNTIYYLADDGKVKMAPISMFQSLVDDTPAEELAYQAGEDAEQEFIQNEEAQIMQPEQSVQPIELETTFQKDGVTYVVSQKSPDGYVVSALDEEGKPVQSNLLTEEQIRTSMTPEIQGEQTSQEQVVQNEDVTQPEQQQAQTEPQTAISRIPVNEKGEHDFESAPYQDTSSALIEISENVDDAKDTAAQMINHYQEELKKADKAKTTGNTIQEIVRLKQQKKANIQSINDKIAYWNSVANDIESKRPGGIIEQAKEESDANQQRLSEMTAEQQQAAQQEVQKKIDSGVYEKKQPRKRVRYVKEDSDMGESVTPLEHVLREIATGRVTFNWNDSGTTQGLGSHLGLASSPEERNKLIWALSSDGMTPEAAAEQIHADMPENLQGMVTDQDIFNMILNSFQEYGSPSKMWEEAKRMHGTDIEENIPGYKEDVERRQLEWEAGYNGMTVSEWIDYCDYIEEKINDMYSSVSDEELNTIFEQIYNEYEQRRTETESAGSTEGQPDGKQSDEVLPASESDNTGTDAEVEEQPKPANQVDGESGSVVPEPEGTVKTDIEKAREDVDQNPTEAQKEAGNYKKGHVKIDGYDVTIENPKGSVRSGKDANGNEWSVTMNNDYGYIRGTEGVDGDHIDVFLSDDPTEGNVYVVDQVNPDGSFDEHKVMYGFNSADEARNAYLSNYEEGWQGLETITKVSKDEFKKWVESSHRKTKPFAEYKSVKEDNNNIRFRETNNEVSVFAQKHNLNEKDVQDYADYMRQGNLNGASGAFHDIRRKIRIDNKGVSLGQFAKIFSPIRKELYENFGNIDEMREQYVQRELEERSVMEAARKRAEEAAEAERRRLQEFHDMSDEQLDDEYMKAVEANDENRMRDLVNEAARRNGYGDVGSEYQGVGAWAAPGNPRYESDEERRAALETDGNDVNVVDMAQGYTPQPENYFTNLHAYGNNTPQGRESAEAINKAMDEARKGNDPMIKVYRAVPKSVKEGKLRNGDWVTPSRKYAEMHGNNRLEGDYRIIEQEVPASQLWWDGNDINEWGFDDGKNYAYRNTRNNRKLNDLITRDDNGNIIPLSQRFNARKSDVRFRFIGEQGATRLDAAEEATTRLDNLATARRMEQAYIDKKARIEKLRDSEPVEITGNEIEPSDDLKQYKKNALEYGKKLQGSYVNKDTGRTIQLQRGRKNGGLKEVLQHDINDVAHIKSVAAIPQIIENSIYIDSADNHDTKKNPNVSKYHYYVCGLKIGGVDYTVRMVEAEDKDGNRYYDHKLIHIEKGNLIDNNETAFIQTSPTELSSTPGTGAEERNRPTNRGEIQAAPISKSKDRVLISLLQTNERENARKIKIATGWERGADGKWRYETPDFEYYPNGDARQDDKYKESDWYKELYALEDKLFDGETLTDEEQKRFDELAERENEIRDNEKNTDRVYLDDYVKDDELFKAYPELKQTRVDFVDIPNAEYSAKYNEQENRITVNTAKSMDNKSVLAHEIQHAIQRIEGFANGSNTDNYRNMPTSENVISDIVTATDGRLLEDGGFDNTPQGIFDALNRKTTYGTILRDYNYELDTVAQKYGYDNIFDLVNDIDKFKSSVQMYLSESGEVEARNVQTRLDMSPEERRQSLAEETEDVAREDQTFLQDALGTSESRANEDIDAAVSDIAGKLNIGVRVAHSIDEVNNDSARRTIEQGRRIQGFYDTRTGEIMVYAPNAVDAEDAIRTVLHEGVAHYGLRRLVGEERMDDFLDDIFTNTSKEVRQRIIDTLPKYGYNSRIATEEYMARMAEKGVDDVSFWDRIKQAFKNLLRRIGININVNDNELRYILWRSRQNLNMERPLDMAKDVAMQYELGVGNYYREIEQTPEQSIIDAWDKIASSTMFSLRESSVDYLTAIDKFQELISKRTGEEIKSFENAYDSMTFLSSKNRVEMDWFDSNIVSPMKKAILELVGKQNSRKWDWNKGVLRQLVMYVEAKHGVERNRQMAIEKYIKELKPESLKFFENAGISIDRDKYKEDLKKTKEEAGKKAYDKSFQSIYDKLINEGLQKEEAESQAKKRAKVIADRAESNASEKFRNDFRDKLMKEYSEKVMSDWNDTKKRISKQKDISWIEKQRELDREASRIGADLSQDYSGLSSVFGGEKEYPDGWYESSLNFVEEYENNHNETSIGDLWKSIFQATDYTLNKQYESGLVNKEYVDRQKQRFENYIPLRGFQDEIAGDVYNYIGNDFYPGSNPVKSAKGRTSEAGNPFGSILNTGYSTISVGNKNLAKMSLYSLVNNHDTEGLAVSNRAWMVRYDKLMQDDDLMEALVIPSLEAGEDIPEWVEAVPKYPEGDISSEEVSRILGRFEDLMKKNSKEGYAKPISKRSRIAYRTLYKERSEHEIPLYILGDKYVITITGNPRVAQAMNGLLNPNVNNKGWAEIGERMQRFMAGAFTAKNAAFSIANLTKDSMYANNQVFIKENIPYWIKFTKKQKAGFGDFIPMMMRLKKYRDGNLDLSDETNKMFKEFMDNGGATGYTFVDTQEKYAKELADKLKELSKSKFKVADPRKWITAFFDSVEFTGQAAELVNRFAAYQTSRDMGRSVTRSIRDAKEITVNFNRKGAGMKSWDDKKSLFDVTNMAAFFSQYGRAYILFWNANMQAKYRFYKNIKEHPIKTSTTLIGNSMMFASVLVPFMNNFVLPALYEMFGIGSGDDDEDYYNTLTDWERTHNICIRLPYGNWLKIALSPEMSPWYTIGDCIGGAIAGQRELSASDFIKSGIDAISPLSINWSYEGANVLLNVLPTISQPVAQVAMNVNFMGNPIKKQPFTIRQGFSPQYKMVYGNTSPALIELSRLSNKLTGGTDGKTSGSLDWNPSLWQNIITGYTGGYGSSFLSAADWIVSTSKGEEQSSTIGKMPLVSRFFISGNKDVKMRRINSSFYDVIKFTEEFKFDQKSLEDEITSSYKEGNALASEESRKKLEELLRSDRARKYIELENIVNSVNDIEKYMKEMPDDETTQAILYQLKTKGIDILKK